MPPWSTPLTRTFCISTDGSWNGVSVPNMMRLWPTVSTDLPRQGIWWMPAVDADRHLCLFCFFKDWVKSLCVCTICMTKRIQFNSFKTKLQIFFHVIYSFLIEWVHSFSIVLSSTLESSMKITTPTVVWMQIFGVDANAAIAPFFRPRMNTARKIMQSPIWLYPLFPGFGILII